MKQKVILILFAFTLPLWAEFDHSHRHFSSILRRAVHTKKLQALVNYTQLKSRPQSLEVYLKTLSSVTPLQYKKFDRNQKLAFLINAYNAFTLKLVIDHYPVDSIKKIGMVLFSPWKKKFFNLLEKKQSLDFIEHEMLRKDFKEPRIHFAIVCASLSCPNLMSTAYNATHIEQQLAEAERNFFRDKNKNVYDSSTRTIRASKVFEWSAEDFEKQYGPIKTYLKKKLGAQGAVKVEMLTYDWGLNDWKPKDK